MKTIVFQLQHQVNWTPEHGEETFDWLSKFLKLWSENDIELHVKEVEKRGTRIEIKNSGWNLAGFDHFKSEILTKIKAVKYSDPEDMVCQMGLTYDEIANVLDVKFIGGSTARYTLEPGIFEISVFIFLGKSLYFLIA